MEKEAETATDFEVVDHDAEIERLQAQIKELQEQKEQVTDGPTQTVMSSAMNEAVRSAADDIDRAQNWGRERRARQAEREQKYEEDKARIENLKETVSQGEVYQEPEPEQPRRSVVPNRAAPPVDYTTSDGQVNTEPSVEEAVDPSVQHLQHLGQEVDPETSDSFMGDDPEAEIQRENDRLARIRAAKAQQQRDLRNQQATAPVRSGRRPPHMAAKDVAEEIAATETEQIGDIDGIPAYRVGQPQELNDKFGQTPPNPSMDPSDKQKGTQNPRFRPPKQP